MCLCSKGICTGFYINLNLGKQTYSWGIRVNGKVFLKEIIFEAISEWWEKFIKVKREKTSIGLGQKVCSSFSIQSLSSVQLFATPWITARQASLSITNSRRSLRLTSIESVLTSSHLILCRPLLLLPPIPPSIRVFSNESTLHMTWPKYWSFSFSIFPLQHMKKLERTSVQFSSVQFSRSVMSDSLRPHELQHARPPCPSLTPRVHSNSRPWSQWCHPAISSSVVPFSSCPQILPASQSFPMSQLSALASFLPKNTQDWYCSANSSHIWTLQVRESMMGFRHWSMIF